MTFSQLFKVIHEAGLSPEKAAEYLGISGMTLRRWKSKPPHRELPKLYANACANVVYQLIAEGRLSPESSVSLQIITDSGVQIAQSTDKVLGLSKDFLQEAAGNSDILVLGLSQIGAKPEHREDVAKQEKRILSFQRWGDGWKRCVSGLTHVLRSDSLTLMDKLVAYGALFYLITPLDLIPDTIPGIGFLDDFAILSLALMYYERRFRHLFKDKDKEKA